MPGAGIEQPGGEHPAGPAAPGQSMIDHGQLAGVVQQVLEQDAAVAVDPYYLEHREAGIAQPVLQALGQSIAGFQLRQDAVDRPTSAAVGKEGGIRYPVRHFMLIFQNYQTLIGLTPIGLVQLALALPEQLDQDFSRLVVGKDGGRKQLQAHGRTPGNGISGQA
ncbi:hypothetical protein FQZ97_879510 [compost metagenome]